MAGPQPTWEPIWLLCKWCGHAWDDWQPNSVPFSTWIAHSKTYRCPQCGKGGRVILIRSQPLNAEAAG